MHYTNLHFHALVGFYRGIFFLPGNRMAPNKENLMLDQITQKTNQPNLIPMGEKEQVVCAIRIIRQDWENLANGQSLIDIQGSVGLL